MVELLPPWPTRTAKVCKYKYSSRLTSSTLDSVAILSQVPVPLAFMAFVLAHYSWPYWWIINMLKSADAVLQFWWDTNYRCPNGSLEVLQWPGFAFTSIAWALTTSKSINCTYKFHSRGLQPIWKATASWGDCHNLATVETSNLCNVKFYRSMNVNELTQTCISSGSAFASGSMQDRWVLDGYFFQLAHFA